MVAGKSKTFSDRAIPMTTSQKKIFHTPGSEAIPKPANRWR
jgi:hypothetical protein